MLEILPEGGKKMQTAEIKENAEKIIKKQYVTFQLGNEEYGINIQKTRGIIKDFSVTNVPNTKKFIMGVINLRGQIVPVVNLHERFNFECSSKNKNQRIITVEIEKSLIGLLVDKVNEVIRINKNKIEPAPEVSEGIAREYLDGLAKTNEELIMLINLNKLLFSEKETRIPGRNK